MESESSVTGWASGFEDELTAAEGDGLSVEADVFDSSNVDPVRLRNAYVAWMTLINSCNGMALEIVQRSNAPNDAWRNLESHYRVRSTLRTGTVVCARALNTGRETVRSAELKRA